jgi:signal transduction histidine kinase
VGPSLDYVLQYNPRMADRAPEPQIDARLGKLLSLGSHELRSPLSAVAGYIRMLLQERAGPVSDDQRRLLQEADKSCGRLSSLLAEMSDLAKLEAGTAPFNTSTVQLSAVLSEAVRALPPSAEREPGVRLPDAVAGQVQGDAVRLTAAFTAIFHALLRELVTARELAVRTRPHERDGTPSIHIAVGEPSVVDDLVQLDPSRLVALDEWRGGTGFALPRARRIIDAHGGRLLSPPESKAAALVILPSYPE